MTPGISGGGGLAAGVPLRHHDDVERHLAFLAEADDVAAKGAALADLADRDAADDGAARVDHVVHDHADAVLDVADDLEHLGLVGDVGVAALVDDGQRRAQGATVADTADEGQFVLLETLSGPTAVAESPTGQLGLDVVDGEGQPCREALEHDHERLAVRFDRGEKTQHRSNILAEKSDHS